MREPVVLFYASPHHPALGRVYQEILRRGRRRAVCIDPDRFPQRPGLRLGVGDSVPSGALGLDGEDLLLEDVVSVCLDGFATNPESLSDLHEGDVDYARTESWATLFALFGQLHAHRLVVNYLVNPDMLTCRYRELVCLHDGGFQVPRALVTSDPTSAREFYEHLQGQVVHRPAGTAYPWRAMEAEDLPRLDLVRRSPVHFEEVATGHAVAVVVVGDRAFCVPEAPERTATTDCATAVQVPAELVSRCVRLCRQLGLWVGQVSLWERQGEWLAAGIRSWAVPEHVVRPSILEAVVDLAEAGRAS